MRAARSFLPVLSCALLLAASCGASQAAPETKSAAPLPRRGFFGALLSPVPDDLRQKANVPAGEGLLIRAAVPGGSAIDAGFRDGDIVLSVDGRPTGAPPQLAQAVGRHVPGEKVEVRFVRDGVQKTVTLTLKSRPVEQSDTYEVLYDQVVSQGARIRTIVTRPKTGGRHPVLFLIQGLGPASMDLPLKSADPYSQILRSFAENGYVTVRVEKPGIGDSEGGPYEETDFDTEMDAYRQALVWIRKQEYVDPANVVIFGHSMGGAFGPILASEGGVKGVATYGTVSKTWLEYWLENTRRQRTLAGDDPAAVDTRVRGVGAALHLLFQEHRTPEQIAAEHPELKSVMNELLPDGKRLIGRTPRFTEQLLARNFGSYWVKGDYHVLAIWGKNEFVATEADHPLIAAMVNRARSGKGTYVALEGSDHGFKRTTSMEDSFRRWNEPGEFNPAIITVLREWVGKVAARS